MTVLVKWAAAAALVAAGAASQAAAIYTTNQGYAWRLTDANMTTMYGLVSASHTVTSGADFSNGAAMAGYDALWLNERLGSGGGASAGEISAISAFIAGGKKAVIITDNSGWAAWNNSIEAITGGVIQDACAGANGSALVSNTLTQGAPTLYSNSCNSLLNTGPTLEMLYGNNMAGVYTVGSGQALVLTSVDILTNGTSPGNYGIGMNTQFANNIVQWLGEPLASNAVPAPPSLALVALGLLALPVFRRRR